MRAIVPTGHGGLLDQDCERDYREFRLVLKFTFWTSLKLYLANNKIIYFVALEEKQTLVTRTLHTLFWL